VLSNPREDVVVPQPAASEPQNPPTSGTQGAFVTSEIQRPPIAAIQPSATLPPASLRQEQFVVEVPRSEPPMMTSTPPISTPLANKEQTRTPQESYDIQNYSAE